MSDQYLGEIRPVGFNFAPVGWALCNGQLLAIAENEALFTLLGTTYGGDGMQSFGLPDLRGRGAIHVGTGGGGTYSLGAIGGSESVTLNANQLAAHRHVMPAQGGMGGQASPSGNFFSASSAAQFGTAVSSAVTAPLLAQTGGSQPHNNLMPYQCANYIIATTGIYPSSM
jgi:microcystin-dependent protein